jgi:hypothetical protein
LAARRHGFAARRDGIIDVGAVTVRPEQVGAAGQRDAIRNEAGRSPGPDWRAAKAIALRQSATPISGLHYRRPLRVEEIAMRGAGSGWGIGVAAMLLALPAMGETSASVPAPESADATDPVLLRALRERFKELNFDQAPALDIGIITDPALLRELRERLYDLNFDPGPPEAEFGEADRQAIRAFEDKNNLVQTGLPTGALLQRLREAGSRSPWGAIVFAKSSGGWGIAWGQASRKEAVASAVSSCGDARQCTVELSFFGTDCAAFAYSGMNWTLTARPAMQWAREAALADCQKSGRNCRIVASVCADGSGRLQAGDKD